MTLKMNNLYHEVFVIVKINTLERLNKQVEWIERGMPMNRWGYS